MNLKHTSLALALTAICGFATSGVALADDHAHAGEELNVHNNTGHDVVVFMLTARSRSCSSITRKDDKRHAKHAKH